MVRIPFVASTSFSAIGMPATADCVAPAVGVSSTASARSRATSGVGVRNAFTSPSTASIAPSEDSRISDGGDLAGSQLRRRARTP